MNKPIERHRGQIKCYSPIREYGFITREKGKDVFFIRSDFANENHIAEGAIIEFDLEIAGKGPKAKNITRIT